MKETWLLETYNPKTGHWLPDLIGTADQCDDRADELHRQGMSNLYMHLSRLPMVDTGECLEIRD